MNNTEGTHHMSDFTFSVNMTIDSEIERLLVEENALPVEFQKPDPTGALNESEVPAQSEAGDVFFLARKRLTEALLEESCGFATLTRADSPSCYAFDMQPKYALTKSMHAAGWRQFHVVVQTVSDVYCKNNGIKRKAVRYPVHIWVAPGAKIRTAMAKIKMDGKRPLSLKEWPKKEATS